MTVVCTLKCQVKISASKIVLYAVHLAQAPSNHHFVKLTCTVFTRIVPHP